MGRRSASLMRGHHSLVAPAEHVAQDGQPFAWTITLSIPAGHLRWRSLRVVPEGRPEANGSTTAQMPLASTRLAADAVLYTKLKRREEEAPTPLTPEEIEAREDLDFHLDRCRREREQESHYARFWVPRLRRLGLIGGPRIPGLPTDL